jgi:UDP-glucose 4-epimerase
MTMSVDTLIHLAFSTKPVHNVREMHELNVIGSLNLLRAALKSRVKNIIIVTSTEAYGYWSQNPFYMDETRALKPNRDFQYAIDTAELDEHCQEYMKRHPGIRFCILRSCFVAGPEVKNRIFNYLEKKVIPVVAGYDPLFQFIHIDDLIEVITKSISTDIRGVYNISGDGVLSLRNMLKLLKKPYFTVVYPVLYPVTELLWYFKILDHAFMELEFIRFTCLASSDKAKRDFGFSPKYNTREAFETYLEHQRIKKFQREKSIFSRESLIEILKEYTKDREKAEIEKVKSIIKSAR